MLLSHLYAPTGTTTATPTAAASPLPSIRRKGTPFPKTRLLPPLGGLASFNGSPPLRGPIPVPSRNGRLNALVCSASLLDNPVLWVGRLCVFYALLKAGLAGSPSSPLTPDLGDGNGDLGFSKLLEGLRGESEDKEAVNRRKLVSKWHPTTKGTLKRSYRVPSKAGGKRLLKAIAALLSEDDHFVDATSHKGCQIRRESAHGESVCCNNVRALFDELPTPHLVVEITAFPAGPLTEKDYAKAEKLERVLRSGSSI
ncbi:hypothetical protein Taro_014099 [Colocasia esculenta]|uniref:Uncharacterized protein n=1 Tax=Colocasia esculenta TaxID=4460 RepID=A0A843UP68_COLES|nr:hypothetical protein [Colocasia esculenta]